MSYFGAHSDNSEYIGKRCDNGDLEGVIVDSSNTFIEHCQVFAVKFEGADHIVIALMGSINIG